jgi:hypothetical protein
MVQEVKAYLRRTLQSPEAKELNRAAAEDWITWIPWCQLAINARVNSSTKLAPFEITHGRRPRLGKDLIPEITGNGPARAGAQLAETLRHIRQLAVTALATAQEEQEKQANRHRQAAPAYQVGDHVWLSLKNRATEDKLRQPRSARHRVTEIIGPRSYRLDTPPGSHNVFHADLLRPAATDAFPSQQRDDWQPDPISMDDQGEPEWEIEDIVGERRRGQGKQYRVKWLGFAQPTWEPRRFLEDTAALAEWEAKQARRTEH